MNYYAIDIETMPSQEAIKYLPEVKANGRLKDEAKIQADIESKKQVQIDKMALSPEFGKIACIGVWGEDRKEVLIGDEKVIIKEFLEFLKEKRPMVYTYNGKGFDFDFIIKRAIFHRLAKLPVLKEWTDKYKAYNHIDLMAEYCKYGEYKSLDLLGAIYLGEIKLDFDVKKIPEMMKTKEGQEQLKAYCLKDCELTYKLAKRFGY